MIYVGIDIAKLNHFDSALSSDGEILIEPFKLQMTMIWLPFAAFQTQFL